MYFTSIHTFLQRHPVILIYYSHAEGQLTYNRSSLPLRPTPSRRSTGRHFSLPATGAAWALCEWPPLLQELSWRVSLTGASDKGSSFPKSPFIAGCIAEADTCYFGNPRPLRTAFFAFQTINKCFVEKTNRPHARKIL